ncbi:MAG: hypothetical protein FWG50_01430, partial [Kiritimatiellaeota bacterium]|nr:hypothetical protein [Kiritimatiellota bacterium]
MTASRHVCNYDTVTATFICGGRTFTTNCPAAYCKRILPPVEVEEHECDGNCHPGGTNHCDCGAHHHFPADFPCCACLEHNRGNATGGRLASASSGISYLRKDAGGAYQPIAPGGPAAAREAASLR